MTFTIISLKDKFYFHKLFVINFDCELRLLCALFLGGKVKHELRVQIYELLVQIHELQVQIHELRGQIHELQVQIHELRVQIHELRVQIYELGD